MFIIGPGRAEMKSGNCRFGADYGPVRFLWNLTYEKMLSCYPAKTKWVCLVILRKSKSASPPVPAGIGAEPSWSGRR